MSEPAPRSPSLLTWLGPALVQAGLAGAIFYRLAWAGPRIEQFFQDTNPHLPPLTRAALCVSRWVAENVSLVLPALLVLGLANAVLLWRLNQRSPAWVRRWFWIGGALLALAWSALEIGYFLPLLKLYEAN